jgi:hypothetical protein
LDGTRIIGKIVGWDENTVFLDIGIGETVDIPKDITKRMLVLVKGN